MGPKGWFETILDDRQPELMESELPMSDIAFYFGWYAENAQGPLTRDSVPFMPGLLPTICLLQRRHPPQHGATLGRAAAPC